MRYERPNKPKKPQSPAKIISSAARPKPPALAPLGGEVYSPAKRQQDLRKLQKNTKPFVGPHPGRSVNPLGEIDNLVGGLIGARPSRFPGNTLESVGIHTRLPHDPPTGVSSAVREHYRKMGKFPPLSASKPSLNEVPFIPGMSPAKRILKELQAHPIRNAFHANIDKTVADKVLAGKIKQSFDKGVLRGAKKEKISPSAYLEKQAADQPEAAHKVIAGLAGGGARSVRHEQEAIRHEQRVQRSAAYGEALKANPTLEGAQQAGAHLKGAYANVEFNGIRGLTNEEVDSLVARVADHPGLEDFQKRHVVDALRNAWLEGKVPSRSDHKLLQEAFGAKFADVAFDPATLSKYRHAVFETLNIPRALMASFDLSAPFRQGLVAFASHPIITGRNLGPMVKYLMSEKGYSEMMGTLLASDDYAELSKNIAITDVEHSLRKREEAFASNYAEYITGLGALRGKPGTLSPVRASGRAYTGFLVKTRVDIYRHLRDLAEKDGNPLDEKGLKQLGDFVNSATGRGDLGRFERNAVGLNALLFSPRLMASRLNFLDPRAYRGLDPFVRKQKIEAALKTAGLVVAVLGVASRVAGVTVEMDPRKSDFGKIKIGNTRIDVAGGFVQYIRFLSTVAATVVGKGDGKLPETALRFARGKASPLASLVADIGTHTNYAGIPIKDWKKEVYDSFIPLVVQDVRDVYHYTGSIPAAVGGALASGTGIGVQSYGAKVQPTAKGPDPKDKLVASFTTYHIPPAAQEKLLGALTARQAVADGKKRLKDTLGVKRLTDKQNAQVLVGVLLSSPTFKPYEAPIRKAWEASSDYTAKHKLIPVLEDKLGFNDLEKYTTRINAREEAMKELHRLEAKATGG